MTRSEASTVAGASGGRDPGGSPAAGSSGAPPVGQAPVVLGRYRLHRQLGAGAFGTVWMARDERLERDVAVKMVPRARIVGGRFEREARAAARLSHPGIVTLYEAGTDDDGAYLVSELVRGSTLGELLDAGRLSDREIIGIGIALCDALSHAHAENVVHRDVKPSNVLVPEQPSNPASVAKLTDFGVARIVDGDTLTRTGDVVGTAAYMAPEQAEGREVGAAADLYALALVLYEALTGVNPVRTGTAAQRARRLGAHLPPLRRQRHDLPRELGQAIDQALRPRARERGSLDELRSALVTVTDRMSDRAGVVAPRWRPGRGDDGALRALPGVEMAAPRRRSMWGRDLAEGRRSPDPRHPAEGRGGADPRYPAEDPQRSLEDPEHAVAPGPLPRTVRWPERGLAAIATAGIAAWMTAHLLPAAPVAPVAAALLAAMLVAALPRIGWLVFVLAASVWLSSKGRTGAALVVVLGGLLPVLLQPRRGAAWALSAGAPALAAIGLAGAWPALAGRARGPWARAALGAAGWVWVMLGTVLSGVDLYLRSPPGSPPPDQWTGSVSVTVNQVLQPLLSSGALAPAAVWAGAAVILPWVVRERWPAVDFVLASAWASGLVAATYASLRIGHATLAGATLNHAVLGGVTAFAVALAPSFVRGWRTGRVSARVP